MCTNSRSKNVMFPFHFCFIARGKYFHYKNKQSNLIILVSLNKSANEPCMGTFIILLGPVTLQIVPSKPHSHDKFYLNLKVPRNPTNFAFICTQVGLILDIFLFFVCKKHYFEK